LTSAIRDPSGESAAAFGKDVIPVAIGSGRCDATAAEPGNIQRTTTSVAYSIAQWDSSLIFGHNKKSSGHSTSSWLAESVFRFQERNSITGRAEAVDKDELFAAGGTFRIKALTLGYSRDVLMMHGIVGAVGGNVTGYSIPAAIKPYYGSPHSFYVFVRLRGHGDAMHGMHSM
jgi:hypothetical protein